MPTGTLIDLTQFRTERSSSRSATSRSRWCPTSARPATNRRGAGPEQRGARREALPDPARHHRVGQVGDDRLDDRERAAAGADPRPEQEPGGAARSGDPRVLPAQSGRVLRQLLRLLPARGVHPVERHVHREGLLDQRGDRPAAPLGHRRAAHAAGHDRRRQRQLHLRHGQPRRVPRADGRPVGRRRLRHAQHPAPAGRHAVRPQRRHPRARQVQGARRHHRGPPLVRGVGAAHRDVRRHRRPARR